MTTSHKIADAAASAAEATEGLYDLDGPPLWAIGSWCEDLGVIARAIRLLNGTVEDAAMRPAVKECIEMRLSYIAGQASALLARLGVEDPTAAFVAEWERAAVKHPGMTLDCDGPTDELRFYALAEEVGEVAASLTYDNAQGTGHGADTIAEVTQVGALALAWLTRYQGGNERSENQ